MAESILEQKPAKKAVKVIEWNGQAKTVREWADITGLSPTTINSRMNILGWTVDRTLSTQPRKRVVKADLSGQRFGMWTVSSQSKLDKAQTVQWLCRCDCGTERWVRSAPLKAGRSLSCGCLRDAAFVERQTIHGMKGSREYQTWDRMKQRCYNPSHHHYADYGGRGITICERWVHSFENFYADMGSRPSENHSIDRLDNNGPYSPRNCRWATRIQQARNTRTNHFLEYKGQTKTMMEWSNESGVSYSTLSRRIRSGWSVEKSLETPVRKRRKNNTKA